MGGFDIGGVFGALKLDDSQFTEALNSAGGASALFKIQLDKTSDGVIGVLEALNKAGYSLQEFATWQGKVREQGYSATAAIKMFSQSLDEAQQRAKALSRVSIVNGTELESYRAKLEAERISINNAKEQYRVQQDYSGLVSRLRSQEAEQEKVNRAGTEEGARQEREYKAQSLSAQASAQRDYTNLVNQLRQEEVTASAKAGQQASANARNRQKEVFSQMQGDVQAQLRMEKEKEEALLTQARAAQAKERAQYIEHRRQMQVASAATTIGTAAVGVGAAGLGIGFLLGKDAAQFQDSMVKSLAVIGDITNQMRDKLAQGAREAAKETGIAAKETAADYTIMAKGGLTAAESLGFLPKAAKFAVATNSDLHDSTKQVISIMEALQIPFSQVGSVLDKLTLSNNLARGSVDNLATSLEGKSGAALRSAKVSLDEALAITIAFSKAGVTASQSQTFLTQIIGNLRTAATKYGAELVDINGKQTKFKDVIYLSDGTMRPFIETLKLLDTAFQGRSASSIDKFFADLHIGAARGGQGLKILLGITDELGILTDSVSKSAGQMGKNFDTQMQSPIRQMAVLKANLIDIAIILGIPLVAAAQGLAHALKPVLDAVEGLAKNFAAWPKDLQQAVALLFGFGSAALVAGGGALLLLGHIVRLRADIALLNGTSGLATMVELLGSAGGYAVLLAVAIGSIVAGIDGMQKKLKEQQNISGSNLSTSHKVAASLFNFAVPPAIIDQLSGSKPQVEVAAQAAGDDAGKAVLDGVRKRLEEKKNIFQDLFKSGDFSINPEELLKKSLKIEDIRQKFSEFSDQYNQVVDRLSASEQEVISTGAARLGKMLANGADPRVVLAAMKSLDDDLRRFKADAAQRDKQDQQRYAQEEAAEHVKAFREKYAADMHDFTDGEKKTIDALLGIVDADLASKTNTKQTMEDLKQVTDFYKILKDSIDDVEKTQRKLNETQSKYESLDRRSQKQKPEIQNPLPQDLQAAVQSFLPIVKQGTIVEEAMKRLGLTSKFAMELASASASEFYLGLKNLGLSTDELRESWLSARSAFIRADEGLKPLHEDFIRIREEIDRIKSEGDKTDRIMGLANLQIQAKALDWQLNGLGKTYTSTLAALTGGFNQLGTTMAKSILDIKNFGKIWKDTLNGIIQGVLGAFLQSLFNMAAAWLAKALGIAVTTKALAASQVNSAAVAAEAWTISSISAIPIVGPAIALAYGESMYMATLAATLPKLAAFKFGGEVDKDKLAMVHGGEYVVTSDLTRGLKAMVANGGMAGGGGDYFNFAGATFGPSLTPAGVKDVMTSVVSKLRRNATKTKSGRL